MAGNGQPRNPRSGTHPLQLVLPRDFDARLTGRGLLDMGTQWNIPVPCLEPPLADLGERAKSAPRKYHRLRKGNA